jgi:hypothetical protein
MYFHDRQIRLTKQGKPEIPHNGKSLYQLAGWLAYWAG